MVVYMVGIAGKNYFRYRTFLNNYQVAVFQFNGMSTAYGLLKKEDVLLDQDWYQIKLIRSTLYYAFDDEVMYLF
tara:strand:- start:324 stop:545 length:222 start_codon:yes stop_codon:yes gene_type:complete